MNSNGKRALVLIVTIAALAFASTAVVAFLASDVNNYGVPETSVGPGTQNVLTLDVQLPDNNVEDAKQFDGAESSALGDPITPFDAATGLAGFLNVGMMNDGETGVALDDHAMFTNAAGMPGGANNVLDPGESIWEDANSDGHFNSGETLIFAPDGNAPPDGTPGFFVTGWLAGLGYTVSGDARAYFRNTRDAGHYDANEIIFFDVDGSAPAGTYEKEGIIYPEGLTEGAKQALAGTPEVNTFGGSTADEVWGDIDGDGTFTVGGDVIWDDTQANGLFDSEPLVVAAVQADGDAGVAFPALARFGDFDADHEFESGDGIWLDDVTANNQFDAGETVLLGPVFLGIEGLPVGSLTNGPLKFIDNVAANGTFDAGEPIFQDVNSNNVYNSEPMLLGAAPDPGTQGTAFNTSWSFSAGFAVIWDDADSDNAFDYDPIVYNPDKYTGDEWVVIDGGGMQYVGSDWVPVNTGIFSQTADTPVSTGFDGVNTFAGAPLDPLSTPYVDLSGVTHRTRYADSGTPGFDGADDGTQSNQADAARGDEIFDDWDNSMTYSATADVVLVDEGPDATEGQALTEFPAAFGFVDLSGDGLWQDGEPIINQTIDPNTVLDENEAAYRAGGAGSLTDFSTTDQFVDLNQNNAPDIMEPFFNDADNDSILDVGEAFTYPSYPVGPFVGQPTVFDNDGAGSDDEFFLGTGGFSADDDIVRLIHDGNADNSTNGGDAVYNFSNDHLGQNDIYFVDSAIGPFHNGIYDSGEPIFWDRNNDGVFNVLTFEDGFTAPGEPDLGDSLNALSFYANFRVDNGTGGNWIFNSDASYISTDATVNAGDVRVDFPSDGTVVAVNEADETSDDARAKPVDLADFKYYDVNGNAAWDSGEPIYYRASGLGAVVETGIERCNVFAGAPLPVNQYFAPGSTVGAGDPELNAAFTMPDAQPLPLTAFQAGVDAPLWFDEDNDGNWDFASTPSTGVVNLEPIYADTDQDGNISPGDVRETAYREGSTVIANAADSGGALSLASDFLASATDNWAIHDELGGAHAGSYDAGDVIYYSGAGFNFAGGRPVVTAGIARATRLWGDFLLADGPALANALGTPFSEDLVANGVLDADLVENTLDETVLGVDLNMDGDVLDPDVAVDLNRDGDTNDTVSEDANGNGILDAPNAFWVDETGDQPYAGTFRDQKDVVRLLYDGTHVVTDGEALQVFNNSVVHFDDGGLNGAPGNTDYDYGEAIFDDADTDLRADIGEAVLAAGLANNVDLDDSGPYTDYAFVDVAPRDGIYEYGEATVFDTGHDEVWSVGEAVHRNSFVGAVTDFTNEKFVDNNPTNGTFDNLAEDIIRDMDDGGTFSTRPDALRKDVPGKTTAEGTALLDFGPDYKFWNERVETDPASPVNGYDYAENDEIFIDVDGDGYYTGAPDVVLFQGAETYEDGQAISFFGTVPNSIPPAAGDNILAGYVDANGNQGFDGTSGAEEDIYLDTPEGTPATADGVVDTYDDLLTSFTVMNPYQAQEPTDISGVFVWSDADGNGVFDPAVDTNLGQATLVAKKAPGDNRTWTLVPQTPIPALTEDRNHDGTLTVLNEVADGVDYDNDGDATDVAIDETALGNGPNSGFPTAKQDDDVDSQTDLFVSINITDDPQQILMGNNFDATIPVDGMVFASANTGPTDGPINNASAPGAGLIHIDNNAPSVTKISDIRLFGFDFDGNGVASLLESESIVHTDSPPEQLFGDNEFEIASPYAASFQIIGEGNKPGDVRQTNDMLEGYRKTELDIYTPSDNDVLFIRMQYASFAGPGSVPPAGDWHDLNYDPEGDAAGDGGAAGFNGLDDDSDWIIANDIDGNGLPSAGEVGVDEMDPQVGQAIAAFAADFVDNDQDGYVDDFEFEAPGTDLDNDGVMGEGFGIDVNGNGINGEPDATPTDNTYTAANDDDEDGVDGIDYADGLDPVGKFFVRDNFNFVVHKSSPATTWTWQWDTYLTQLRLSGNPIAARDGIWVKAIAYDQAENVVETYAAPTVFLLDNTAPEAEFKLASMDGTALPNDGTVSDDEVYQAGATCADTDVQWVELTYAKNSDPSFLHAITDATHSIPRIHSLEEHIDWTPDFVTNSPADTQDDYYFVARASDRLEWFNITTQVWQPYIFHTDPADPTANVEIGNEEQIVMGNNTPADLAELHEVAVDGTMPHAVITRVYAKSWFDDNASKYFEYGVRVPSYNAVEIWVQHEDLNENHVIDTVTEADAETYMGCDLNGSGGVEADVNWDLNQDGAFTSYSEDLNSNGRLDDLLPGGQLAVDDGDTTACENDIAKIVFEVSQDHTTWTAIATVNGTIDGDGHVADFTYPVVVTWDTTDPTVTPEGEYDLRAVAYDVEGNVDPNPTVVTVTVDRSGLNAYFSPYGAPADSAKICGVVDLHSVVFGTPADDVGSTRVLYRYIRGEEAQAPVADIVFLIDSSSSMQDAIDRVKAATTSFASALGSTGVDYQLALLDLAPGGAAPPVLLQDLTTDVPAFQAALNTLNVLPDALVASYDALVGANASTYGISWRPDADRVLVLVTDTVPELGNGSGLDFCANPNPTAENDVIAALGTSAKVFAITDLSGNPPCADNAYDQISLATQGLLYDINSTDYAPVLADIAGTIVGGFWTEIGADEDADQPAPTNTTDWADYVFPWDTSGLPEGWVTVEAIALDELGNSDADRSDPGQRIHVYIDNTAPTPSFVLPLDGTVISENNGNTVLDVAIDTNDYEGTDEVMLEWSLDGVNWHQIDGINNDEDFFTDGPAGALMMYDAGDAIYTKGAGNTDMTKVEVGDHRMSDVLWTVPTYTAALNPVVGPQDQDRGFSLLPFMKDGVNPDPDEASVDNAPERTGPFHFTWLTKNTIGPLENDVLVYLRATATQHCSTGSDLSADTQIVVHVTDNVAPNTTLVTVTEPDGDIIAPNGTQTLDNTLSIFATAADHGDLTEQGSVVDVSLWFRPREQDLDLDGLADYDQTPQPGAAGDQWLAWTRAASDTTYPYIFDWDVSGLNGPYEIAIVATDSQGNRSVIDETMGGWLMITHMAATVTAPLDTTICEGVTVTLSADLVSHPVDDAFDVVHFYRASAVLGEAVTPVFMTQGTYAGFWVGDLVKDIQDPDGDPAVGSDVRVHIGGVAGTYFTFATLSANPTPASTDFAIDYGTNQIIFGVDPGVAVTIDYHTSIWIPIAIGDEAAPYTVDWQTARDGSDVGVWSIMARAETRDPLANKEPPYAEWAIITVNDCDSPNFHVGGLGHQEIDDPAFYPLATAKLGNSINELSSLPPETKLSGDEVDLMLTDDDAPADPLVPSSVVARLVNEATGAVFAEQAMTAASEDVNGIAMMPITFKFFESDWLMVVESGDFENVTLWLDRDDDGAQDLSNELYPMNASGGVWTVTVGEIAEGSNLNYQFLVDTVGDNFDINGDGVEDPVDDPRNDTNPISYTPGAPGTPWHFNLGDSAIILPETVDYWTNIDISTVPDGVYRFEFTGMDANDATTTVGKRVVIDRSPITQHYAVNVMNNNMGPDALKPLTSAPAHWLVGLQTYLVDDPGGVNIVDPTKVLFQYFDGQAWRWATIVGQDTNPVDGGWFMTWLTPTPGSTDDHLDNDRDGAIDEADEGDGVDNDNDGSVDEADEAQSVFQIRAVVFDDGFNVSYTPAEFITNLTIDGMPAQAEVKLAETGGTPPQPANGVVIRMGDPVTFYGQYTSAEKPVAVVFQWSPSPAGESWHDIDVTPIDETDDYFTPIMGQQFETPDFDDDVVVDGTHYFTATLNTESIRQMIFDDLGQSGDAYVEVRALAVDAVGNTGAEAKTSLVILNDTDGPVAYFWQLQNLTNNRMYWPDDPLAAFTGQAMIWALAAGMSSYDAVTGTLQISADGVAWTDVTTVPLVDAPFGNNRKLFIWTMNTDNWSDGNYKMRALVRDADGNIGGDTDGNGVIDGAETVPTITVRFDHTPPAAVLVKAGGLEIDENGTTLIVPNHLPDETEFVPVLPTTVTFKAEDSGDSSTDIDNMTLQFRDDFRFPREDETDPRWLTIGTFEYRDYQGDDPSGDSAANGQWLLDFSDLGSIYGAMSDAGNRDALIPMNQLAMKAYQFRPLATDYAGNSSSDAPGQSLRIDAAPPMINDLFAGTAEMEGGGTDQNTDPLHVAGGDVAPLGAAVNDKYEEQTGPQFESGGMFGVRMEYRPSSSQNESDWTTIGLMTAPVAPYPTLWQVSWTTPTNVAWADSLFTLRATARDSAGNVAMLVRKDAVLVQDVTAPCNTRLTDIAAAGGQILPVDVTETTLGNGTWVGGAVDLFATTAAGDQSMLPGGRAEVHFEAHRVDWPANQWVLIQSASDTVSFEQMFGADNTLGEDWSVAWNTMAVDGNGAPIFPDGQYQVRTWATDVHGNSEKDAWTAGTCSAVVFNVTVDNTAPMATMDFDPSTPAVETEGSVERNQVFTAFARTQTETEDDVVEFMYKLHTDLNVPSSWKSAQPGYDDTDVNPDETRPYSFDWDLNQMTPMLTAGGTYDVVAASSDLLMNQDTAVQALIDGRGLLLHVQDTVAPKATITKLVRAVGDEREVEFPEEEHVRGSLELWATILKGDHDTESVDFFFRAEGSQTWILADGDRDTTGDFTWVLRNWDTTPLAEGRYQFAAIAEDDAGNRDQNPNMVIMIVDHSAPTATWLPVEGDVTNGQCILPWQDGFTAATLMESDKLAPMIPNRGPDPRTHGWVAPHGTSPDSLVVYTITIVNGGDVGAATFDWAASNDHTGTGITTGGQVWLEGTVWVQFTGAIDSDGLPSANADFHCGDVFTFSTDGRIVDLVSVSTDTDVWRGDDTQRPIYEYKRADDPDDDPYWTYATITPSTPLHDDILNSYSSTWDVSDLASCLFDLRVTYDDRAGNRNIVNYTNPDGSFKHVTVDNVGPEVAITNIANNGNDTTEDPVDFGTITDVTLGKAVKIFATADDDEQCIPASAETYVNKLQFQVLAGDLGGGNKADIVWVIDGSGSMGDDQAAIASNAEVFANALAGKDVQFGVVWFGDSSGPINTNGTDGAALAGTGQFTSSVPTFGTMVQAVGTGRSGSEDGLNALDQTLQHYTFRQGAKKFFVLVGDEPTQTTFLAQALPMLQSAGVTVYSVITTTDTGTQDYKDVALQTGGAFFDITGNWGQNLSAIGVQIAAQVGGTGWQDLGVVQPTFDAGDPTDVTASVVWNTTGLPEGVFYLRVLAFDTACNMTISKIVQVNVKDNTPPTARIAGFDPDVIPHGDEPNTESTVYALTYSDDEITEVQFQYDIVNANWPAAGTDPDGLGWINIGIGTEVIGGQFPKDNLWMAKFNLSAFDASVVKRMRVRALAKDSDGNRDDVNAPVLVADLVTNADQSRKLVPVLDFNRITGVNLSAPSGGNVILTVSTADPSEMPKAIAVSENLEGDTVEQIVDFTKMVDSDVTWTGVLSLSGIAACGEMNISVTALAERSNDQLNPSTPDTVDIEMQETLIASYQVNDAVGTNGVVAIDGLSVYVPSGSGVSGCLLLAPTTAPTVSYDQGLYLTRLGNAFDIEWTSGGGAFNPGYGALLTMDYTQQEVDALAAAAGFHTPSEVNRFESLLSPRWFEGSTGFWSAGGVTHVMVDTTNNVVSFRAASLDQGSVGTIWSLFAPTSNAPVYVYNVQPWSNGFTSRAPQILAYLNDYSGEGINEDEIEVWIDNRIVAASGTGYVLGNGNFEVHQINNEGTMYSVWYDHSTYPVDALPAGQHSLNIRFRTIETDTWVGLDPAAPLATFGVDRKPPYIAFRGGFVSDPLLRNIAGYIGPTTFLTTPHTMLQAQAFDGDAGMHVREEQTQDPIGSWWDEGLKYDLWWVNHEDDQHDVDEIEQRTLLHQGTADELVPYLSPSLDEYTPNDTLLVSLPIVGGGVVQDHDILEVTLYSSKEIEENSDGPGFGCDRVDTLWVGNEPVLLCDNWFLDSESQEMHIYLQGWRDEVGNAGSPYVEQRFVVDRSAPTVEIVSPSKDNACVSPTEDVQLSFRVNDSGAGVNAASIRVSLQGPNGEVTVGTPTFSSGSLAVTVPASTEHPLSFGTYSGTVSGMDLLGNTFEIPFSFSVCTNNLEVFAPKVFPNPFNPNEGGAASTAQFSFTLGRQADVSMEIYDFAGDKVATLASRVTKAAGPVVLLWAGQTDDGGDLANGVYIARLTVTDGTRTQNVNLKVVIWRD